MVRVTSLLIIAASARTWVQFWSQGSDGVL